MSFCCPKNLKQTEEIEIRWFETNTHTSLWGRSEAKWFGKCVCFVSPTNKISTFKMVLLQGVTVTARTSGQRHTPPRVVPWSERQLRELEVLENVHSCRLQDQWHQQRQVSLACDLRPMSRTLVRFPNTTELTGSWLRNRGLQTNKTNSSTNILSLFSPHQRL